MSKNTRISNKIERIENRFKTKVSKGRKGTDMDIEMHERRIEKLRGKQRKNTLQHESQHSALHRNSPLGFTMPHSPLNQNDSIKNDTKNREIAINKFKQSYANVGKVKSGEYDREKGEFHWDGNKISLIPTDDGEVQQTEGIQEKNMGKNW